MMHVQKNIKILLGLSN